MAEGTYGKVDIARTQIDTAIRLFEEGEDLFSVITLAGAADEIFGGLLRERGGESSFDTLRDAAVKFHDVLFNEPGDAKVFADRANRARNSLKHHGPGDDSTVTLDVRQEAIDMVDRAITNHWRLSYDLSPAMRRFTEMQRSGSL